MEVEEQSEESGPADDLSSIVSKAVEASNDEVEKAVEELSTDTPESEDGPDEQPSESEPEEPSAEASEGDDEEDPAGEAEGQREAPENWPAKDREAFSKLPVEAQDFLLRRHGEIEKGFLRKTEESANEVKFAGAVKQLMQPVMPMAQRNGLDEVGALRSLVAAWDMSNRDPEGFIRQMAQRHNLDLGELAYGRPDQETDPAVSELRQQLAAVQQQLQQGKAQQEESVYRGLQQEIADFQQAKDDAGNPKHPHFEAVKTHMAGLLQAGSADSLDAAYEMAVWAAPELRSQLLESQKKAAAEEERKRRKEAIERGREASSVTPPSGRSAARAPEDLSDIVADAVKKAGVSG